VGWILLDIEGTIAPISFVYDVMFPFAREHLPRVLSDSWDAPDFAQILSHIERDIAQEIAAGTPGAIALPQAPVAARQRAVLENLRAQMDHDRKTTGLKAIQGRVWRQGFEDGRLRSVVFPDVPAALGRWRGRGLSVGIYSSGSVEAQQLFMRYCEQGDLSQLVDAWFDTTTGPKREANSYATIAERCKVVPAEVMFYTDVAAEAAAAREAGMSTTLVIRPGNAPVHTDAFPKITAFTEENS
jgi:2,3-diketo-5-methylthio-1-phosphopentane phosphatase